MSLVLAAALLMTDFHERQSADARLIALAPEMAELLEVLADGWFLNNDYFTCGVCRRDSNIGQHEPDCPSLRARDLLARARGETA